MLPQLVNTSAWNAAQSLGRVFGAKLLDEVLRLRRDTGFKYLNRTKKIQMKTTQRLLVRNATILRNIQTNQKEIKRCSYNIAAHDLVVNCVRAPRYKWSDT